MEQRSAGKQRGVRHKRYLSVCVRDGPTRGLLQGRTQAIDTHPSLKGSRRKIGGSAQEGRASDQGLRPMLESRNPLITALGVLRPRRRDRPAHF
jgi:hypothetical protein